MRTRLLLPPALASAATLLLSTTSLASVTQVSGPVSPYAACTPAATQPGVNYPNAEVEPQIAVNPTNPDNWVAQWHQDRWDNGGARGIAGGYTIDGGVTWSDVDVPYTNCAPGGLPYERGSDPWVSFGPDGTAYSSALSFDGSTNRNAVSAAVSHDGGKTWKHQQAIVAFPNAQTGTDKNATTADPYRPGVAYTVWDNLISPTDHPDDRIHAAAYTGPAEFSMTGDHGATWSAARTIVGTGNRQQTIGNVVVVGPGDVLYDFFDLIVPPNTPRQGTNTNAQVAFIKSTDGGATWTSPQVIAPFHAKGALDPNTGEAARVGDGLEEVAIDHKSGRLYVVWESSTNWVKNLKQSTGAFDNEVLLATSGDGGRTWSVPRAVVGPSALPIFIPTVAVGSDGTVALTYYDSKDLSPTNTTTWPIDYMATFSSDSGATWSTAQQIAGPFDMRSAPKAPGFFLGDYEGLQPVPTGFAALFVTTNCALNPSDPNAAPSGNPLCGPASSTALTTPNNDPTNVFSALVTPS